MNEQITCTYRSSRIMVRNFIFPVLQYCGLWTWLCGGSFNETAPCN